MEPILTPILVAGAIGKVLGGFGSKHVGSSVTKPELGTLTLTRKDSGPASRPLAINHRYPVTALRTSSFEDAVKGVKKLHELDHQWPSKSKHKPDIALLHTEDQGYVAAALRSYASTTTRKSFLGEYKVTAAGQYPPMLHDRKTAAAALAPSQDKAIQLSKFTFKDGTHVPSSADLHAVIGHKQLVDLRPTQTGGEPIVKDLPRKFLGIF